MPGEVKSLSSSRTHAFSKTVLNSIELLEGLGVAGDAHMGETVKHRSRVAQDPTQPNLRQIHLIAAELLDELNSKGFKVNPGDLGENILTGGIDLLDLWPGAILEFSGGAVIEVTGLRNPCQQIEDFRAGLLAELRPKDSSGAVTLRAGIMGVVRHSGKICTGDTITMGAFTGEKSRLKRV